MQHKSNRSTVKSSTVRHPVGARGVTLCNCNIKYVQDKFKIRTKRYSDSCSRGSSPVLPIQGEQLPTALRHQSEPTVSVSASPADACSQTPVESSSSYSRVTVMSHVIKDVVLFVLSYQLIASMSRSKYILAICVRLKLALLLIVTIIKMTHLKQSVAAGLSGLSVENN